MKANFKIFLLFLLLPLSTYAKHGDSEFKRTIVKELSVSGRASCKISNKYGKILVHTWDKSQVKAVIVVTGFGKSNDEAQSIANMVEVDMENNGGEITFRTHYNPSSSGNKWFSFSGKKDSKDYVNIDYELFVPEKMEKMTMDNNFGDIMADVLPFPTIINLNYGNLDIKEVGSLTINMTYCDKVRIGKATELHLNATYSKIKSDEIGSMVARSNYTEYTIGKINSLDAACNYDDYGIMKAGTVKVQSTYTDFRINELQTSVDGRLTYGDFLTKSILPGFKGATLRLTYSDVKLGLSTSVQAQIKLNLRYGDLHTGEQNFKNVVSVKKSSNLNYTAFTSNGGEWSPVIDVDGIYSDVNFIEK